MNDGHIARPGGRIVPENGVVHRLAQNCWPTYGYSLNAFVIRELSKTEYRESPFEGNPVLSPGRTKWTLHGMHHMDAHELRKGEWIACVDGYTRKTMLRLNY